MLNLGALGEWAGDPPASPGSEAYPCGSERARLSLPLQTAPDLSSRARPLPHTELCTEKFNNGSCKTLLECIAYYQGQ